MTPRNSIMSGDEPLDTTGRAGLQPRLTFDRFATAIFFLALAATACLMPAQSDTWWQLRTGQDMVASGVLAFRDHYSHTVNGGYWPNHEWLSQVILYNVYRVGGLPGLTAFAAAIVTAAWAIVWRLTPGGVKTRLVLSVLAVAPFATEWSLRPQIFTLLCMATTVWLLVQPRYVLLPLLFGLWANLHGGVMLGGIVVFSHGVASMVSERRLFTRPMVVGGLCALMTGATPLGFSLWTEVPAMLDRLQEYGVREWQPPSLFDQYLATFWLLLAAFAWLAWRNKPWREDPARAVTFWGVVALLPVAMNASRNVPALLILMVPAVGMLASRTPLAVDRPEGRAGLLGPRIRRERPALNAAVLAAGCVVALVAVVQAWAQPIPKLQWRPLSRDVITAVASCPDSLYNRFDEGGYLIWFVPGRKVFIDNRQDPYPPELMREHIRVETTGEYQDLFNRYSIRCAFIPRQTVLAQRLTSDGWTPLYQDAIWAVLTAPAALSVRR
jgi:hypothetical protein